MVPDLRRKTTEIAGTRTPCSDPRPFQSMMFASTSSRSARPDENDVARRIGNASGRQNTQFTDATASYPNRRGPATRLPNATPSLVKPPRRK